jgi:hypothetical protein
MMAGNERKDHWTPQEMHGIIPMPDDGDIPGAINKAMRRLVPKTFRRPVSDHDYLVHTNADGSQSIVFEVKENDY